MRFFVSEFEFAQDIMIAYQAGFVQLKYDFSVHTNFIADTRKWQAIVQSAKKNRSERFSFRYRDQHYALTNPTSRENILLPIAWNISGLNRYP